MYCISSFTEKKKKKKKKKITHLYNQDQDRHLHRKRTHDKAAQTDSHTDVQTFHQNADVLSQNWRSSFAL